MEKIESLYNLIKDRKIGYQEAILEIQNLKKENHIQRNKEFEEQSISIINRNENLSEVLQANLIQIIYKILKIEITNFKKDLKEYFIDAHTVSLFTKYLNDEYGIDLTPSILYDYPLIEDLTNYLIEEYDQKIIKIIKNEANTEYNIPYSFSSSINVREKTINYLKEQLSLVTKFKIDLIEADSSIENYGIDSVMMIQIIKKMELNFGALPKTLFFEYQNLNLLTDFLLLNYNKELNSMFGIKENNQIRQHFKPQPVFVKSKQRVKANTSENDYKQNKNSEIKNDDIAIIGVSGRYPDSTDIEKLWENLKNGNDCVDEIPLNRWDNDLYYDEDKSKLGKTYCKWGGFIDGFDEFDPLFFNISPREAEILDPQERLFLQTVSDLLEKTGHTQEVLHKLYNSKVGLYVGAMYQQYNLLNSDIIKESLQSLSSYNSIASRISYFFNLQGPSTAVDTMCSSSLISIHMAIESIRKGECGLAIAGGVNLSIHPKKYIGLSISRMIGSDLQSRSFTNGDGYLPAEGVGAVLLKPLSKAIEDNDSILGVIKSTSVNHNGRSTGYMVPNPKAQSDLIRDNFKKAGVDPRTISYVEAAANGSELGDAIEFAALSKAFGDFTTDKQFCAIGSVKSNIGHAEAASGISQLTKVLLQLQHKQLVPTIHTANLNPNINFSQSPFYLQKELQEWNRPTLTIEGKEQTYPRRATVSSFGAGGANAHLIIEEYIAPETQSTDEISTTPQIIILSAKDGERLEVMAERLLEFIENREDILLQDLAYTLQTGREMMDYKLALIAQSTSELAAGLKGFLDGKSTENGSIPCYLGNTATQNAGIKNLFSGKSGLTILEVLLREGDYEKLALSWVNGNKIPWELLYKEKQCKRIVLPTYPFKKEKYWIKSKDNTFEKFNSFQNVEQEILHVGDSKTIKSAVVQLISNLLDIDKDKLDLDKPLDQYGLDSILFMQLVQQIQLFINPSIDSEDLLECESLNDISEIVSITKDLPPNFPAFHKKQESNLNHLSQFPELIHLNKKFEGRPVFWFHAALGGVQAYKDIAQLSERPFYGIQARGWMTNRAPLHGIQAAASYYVFIIKSLQDTGPYDLGGYSLGGVLAYEVSRQLQELGDKVNSIVMLDSIYNEELKRGKLPQKTAILQAVNMSLLSNIEDPTTELITKTLIHRDEVNIDSEDDVFLKELVLIASQRGLNKTESQLQKMIKQNVKVQHAYEIDNFSIVPLTDSNGVDCYYFRNKEGKFFGEFEPYYTIKSPEKGFDNINYWDEWEKQLPNLRMFDVDSSSHMTLLSEPKASKPIFEFCKELYSTTGCSKDFIDTLIIDNQTIIS